VITGAFCNGRNPVDVLEDVLSAGVKLIQFREKDMTGTQLYELGSAFRERTAEADALLIVNDRIDIALAIEADGVHLGQSDLPVDVAKDIAPDLIIGASTHNLQEALGAQAAGADYVNIGPIFATQTKSVPTGVVGPEMLDVILPHLTVPFSCMGGIKAHNIAEVVEKGARHPAVVTAVTAADDIQAAAAELRRLVVDNSSVS
jgi:thiamine-phosphate pyrophosphorylase